MRKRWQTWSVFGACARSAYIVLEQLSFCISVYNNNNYYCDCNIVNLLIHSLNGICTTEPVELLIQYGMIRIVKWKDKNNSHWYFFITFDKHYNKLEIESKTATYESLYIEYLFIYLHRLTSDWMYLQSQW